MKVGQCSDALRIRGPWGERGSKGTTGTDLGANCKRFRKLVAWRSWLAHAPVMTFHTSFFRVESQLWHRAEWQTG